MGLARGGIGGTTNYIGNVYVDIIERYAAGDVAGAVERQNYAQQVINVVSKYGGNIVAGKRIMALIGLDCGPNRAPLATLSDADAAAMRAELEAIDFFNNCNK